MNFDHPGNITRKEFLEVAGAVCGACLSWGGCSEAKSGPGAALGEKPESGTKVALHLAAACGTYCGACPAYIRKYGGDETRFSPGSTKGPFAGFVDMMGQLRCDGCMSGGTLAAHCRTCNIRLCAANKQKDGRCTDCKDLLCYRIANLVNQGNYPHRQEYLPNLEKIRQMGVEQWVTYEQERWRCPGCGLAMSWYDAK